MIVNITYYTIFQIFRNYQKTLKLSRSLFWRASIFFLMSNESSFKHFIHYLHDSDGDMKINSPVKNHTPRRQRIKIFMSPEHSRKTTRNVIIKRLK